MYKNFKVIDSHCHIYPEKIAAKASVNLGNFYNFVVEGEGTYSHLEKQGSEFGVGGFLIVGFVGLNFVFELIVNIAVAPALSRLIDIAKKKFAKK